MSCRYPTLWPLTKPFLWPFSYALLSTNAVCSLPSSTSLAGAWPHQLTVALWIFILNFSK